MPVLYLKIGGTWMCRQHFLMTKMKRNLWLAKAARFHEPQSLSILRWTFKKIMNGMRRVIGTLGRERGDLIYGGLKDQKKL